LPGLGVISAALAEEGVTAQAAEETVVAAAALEFRAGLPIIDA
jgi:hypothetical protein